MPYTDVILSQPPKGGYMKCKEMIGHRIVIFGTHGIEEQPDTMSKVPGATRQVATIDYVDLDDGQGGIIQWGAQVDKPGVVNKLRGQVTAIMGRMTLGEAKQGQSAPFILADHEPGDAEFFNQVWLPANRDALAGKRQQQSIAQQQAPQQAAPQQQLQQQIPAPQQQQPVYQPAAAAMAYPQVAQPVQQPAPLPQAYQQPQYQQPAAAAPAAGGNGAEAYPPEALAALQRMMESGQLPAFPAPGQ